MSLSFGPRRGQYVDIAAESYAAAIGATPDDLALFESFDLVYRSLCAVLYNYVPMSGHPGGSIS